MVYSALVDLKSRGKLRTSSITVSDSAAVRKKRYVFGREITGFDRRHIRFRGGESGYEELSLPLEKIIEIESGGRIVFKRKPRIKKVYPR
jgi:hypothetical protein